MKSSSLTFTPFSLWLSKLDSSYKKMNTGKACDEGDVMKVSHNRSYFRRYTTQTGRTPKWNISLYMAI